MEIRIRNNFESRQVSRKGAGIGLRNVRNRMMLIYGRDDLVQINKSETAFEVKLQIPQI
jgi:LytS/YehU family sensor histidine kinase